MRTTQNEQTAEPARTRAKPFFGNAEARSFFNSTGQTSGVSFFSGGLQQQQDQGERASILGDRGSPEIQRQVDHQQSAPPQPPVASTGTSASTGPPVLFGLNTATRLIYASVAMPGHSIQAITRYIYGSEEMAIELQNRNGVADFVPPGRNLILVDGIFSPTAHQAVDRALDNGTILRTDGITTGMTGDQLVIYQFSAAGQQFELTPQQMRGMAQGLGVWLFRKAEYIRNLAQGSRDTHQEHLDGTNSVVRGISDWLADQDELPVSIWNEAISTAQSIVDTLQNVDFNGRDVADGIRIVPEQAQHLDAAARALDAAKRQWHMYIENTIAGADVAVHRLELVRNVSFAVAAGLAGAVAAPVVFAAAGTGLATVGVTGTAATVLSSTAAVGAGALAGGTLQGTLNVVAPGAQADQAALDRFGTGFRQGAISGGLGAAGALAAPGVSGAISQRLYGAAPGALTTAGARATVGGLTGLAIGAPSGAIGSALEHVAAFARGEISGSEYLERIGWGAVWGGSLGAALGAISGALSRGPGTGLQQQRGAGSSQPLEPDFILRPPEVNPQTGVVTQMAYHRPTGQVFRAEYNPATGQGQIINLSTGQQVGTVANGQFYPGVQPMLASGQTGPGAGHVSSTSGAPPGAALTLSSPPQLGAPMANPALSSASVAPVPTTGTPVLALPAPAAIPVAPTVPSLSLAAARAALPAHSIKLSNIEAALAYTNPQVPDLALPRVQAALAINDVAQMQVMDHSVMGLELWIDRANGSSSALIQNSAHPSLQVQAQAIANARDVHNVAAEVIEARRLALQTAQTSGSRVRFLPQAGTTSSFDLVVENMNTTGLATIARRIEVFHETGLIFGASVFDTGIVHGGSKIPPEILSGQSPHPPESYESTIQINWPEMENQVGNRLYQPDGSFEHLNQGVRTGRTGHLRTELLVRLNRGRLSQEERVIHQSAIQIVDQNGRLLWRFTHSQPGQPGGWQ